MADYPPYMNAYGLIPKILKKIKKAKTPDRFTGDFLSTKLGFETGSAKAFISFAKRIDFLSSDGSPTELYKRFRNSRKSEAAMAKAIKIGYSEVFERNEYANELNTDDLKGLVMEITGLEKKSKTLRAICSSFEALKDFADFDATLNKKKEDQVNNESNFQPETTAPFNPNGQELDLNLAYSINIVLPKTDDIAVFNAIFKSLRENLLDK